MLYASDPLHDAVNVYDAPALPPDAQAVDVATDAKGRVLLADNGPRQQILIFSKSADGGYAMSGTLGERGGIFSGVAGRPGPQRFNGLTGVGVDRAGNVYVATNGIGPRHGTIGAGLGSTLESYAPDGRLRWQVQGLLFVDGAWIDRAGRTACTRATSASSSICRSPRARSGNMRDSCRTASSIRTTRCSTPINGRGCRSRARSRAARSST